MKEIDKDDYNREKDKLGANMATQSNVQTQQYNESNQDTEAKLNMDNSFTKGNHIMEHIETTQPNENCSMIMKQASVNDIISQGEELHQIFLEDKRPNGAKTQLVNKKKAKFPSSHTNTNSKACTNKKTTKKVIQSKQVKPFTSKKQVSINSNIKNQYRASSSLEKRYDDKLLIQNKVSNHKKMDNVNYDSNNNNQKINQSLIVSNQNDISITTTPKKDNTFKKKKLKDLKFDKTYDRFAQKIEERNKKMALLKKSLREQEEKCFRKIPMINMQSKNNITDNFYSRLEKNKQEAVNKKEQLKKIIEIEEEKKINKDRILPIKNKGDVSFSIEKIMEWERERLDRLEKQKTERYRTMMREYKDKPTINRRSAEIARRRNIDEDDDKPFNRLFKEGVKLKEKKKMLTQLYTPSFKPKLNITTYNTRRDTSYCDEVQNTDFVTENLQEMFREKIKTNRYKSQDQSLMI